MRADVPQLGALRGATTFAAMVWPTLIARGDQTGMAWEDETGGVCPYFREGGVLCATLRNGEQSPHLHLDDTPALERQTEQRLNHQSELYCRIGGHGRPARWPPSGASHTISLPSQIGSAPPGLRCRPPVHRAIAGRFGLAHARPLNLRNSRGGYRRPEFCNNARTFCPLRPKVMHLSELPRCICSACGRHDVASCGQRLNAGIAVDQQDASEGLQTGRRALRFPIWIIGVENRARIVLPCGPS